MYAGANMGHPCTVVQRNSPLLQPGYVDVDMSLFKNMLTGERVSAQFQAEAFNTFKRVNFGNPQNSADANTAPVNSISSGTYGQITSATSPRVFQFGLKLLF